MAMPCMAWLCQWEAAPACPGRDRPRSPLETIERADPALDISARPSLSVLTTSNPYVPPKLLIRFRPFLRPEAGLPQFLHSATSRPCPRPHTGFDPGYDPVKEEGYGGSMGDSAVRASEPGIPLWRRGMGNPPQPCYAKHCIAMHGIAMQCNQWKGSELSGAMRLLIP
jgi:hypothetical protein